MICHWALITAESRRCLKPLVKNIGNTIPDFKTADDHPLRSVVSGNVPKAIKAYEDLDFQAAGEAALQIARAGNKYMDENAPWSLFKDGKIEEGSHVLLSILEVRDWTTLHRKMCILHQEGGLQDV